MGRADDCEYDERAQKSRTQKLQEKMVFLEGRLRELETSESIVLDPRSTSGSSTVHRETSVAASVTSGPDYQTGFRFSPAASTSSSVPTLSRSTPSADSSASPAASIDLAAHFAPPHSLPPNASDTQLSSDLVLASSANSLDPEAQAVAWLANAMGVEQSFPFHETADFTGFPTGFPAHAEDRVGKHDAQCFDIDGLMAYFEEEAGPEYRFGTEATGGSTSALGSGFTPDARIEPGSGNHVSTVADDPLQSLSPELKRTLLASFAAHRHQCWFDSDVSRFEAIIDNPGHPQQSSEIPHPALTTAVYLLGCAFASASSFDKEDPLSVPPSLEGALLTRAQREVHAALAGADRLVDVVRASALVAAYLYARGRTLEGYTHAFAGARLAAALGLHRMHAGGTVLQLAGFGSEVPLAEPRDMAEWHERVSAFWQAFAVDRCWSVALGLPVGLPHGETPSERIVTPWLSNARSETESGLYGASSELYMPALKAKAAAFYERTSQLPTNDPAAIEPITAALHAFAQCLTPSRELEPWRNSPARVDPDLILVHTLVHISFIQIHNSSTPCGAETLTTSVSSPRAPGAAPSGTLASQPASQTSTALSLGTPLAQGPTVPSALASASAIVALAQQLADTDFLFLDPIISVCWSHAATAWCQAMEADKAREQQIGVGSTGYWDAAEQGLDILIYSLRKLSACFPIARYLIVAERERTKLQAALNNSGIDGSLKPTTALHAVGQPVEDPANLEHQATSGRHPDGADITFGPGGGFQAESTHGENGRWDEEAMGSRGESVTWGTLTPWDSSYSGFDWPTATHHWGMTSPVGSTPIC
ncbi:hypothetical protein HGRIS_013678 [Hohenbuehelia grisea]|uniref:Xylanolytic transcriptional activator regulatory domain-containing protein n=1 Tax=Hohenbuehelia grisea TaxID=104357 RepID=A0ABR3IWH1_9AGAR